MGYRIDYQTVAGPKKTGKRQHPLLILSLCLLAAVFFNTIAKDQRAMLLRILFPGDVAVTAASFDNRPRLGWGGGEGAGGGGRGAC